jgi:cation:H+ antiporter
MNFLLLAVGFAALIKSADILIDSASKLAKMFGIPSFIVGFSVIAFGTSAPELVIGIFSGIEQSNLITLGDVIGSCIANIALIIGLTAVIRPIAIDKSVLYTEIPLSFCVQLLLFGMLIIGGVLSRIDAVILLVFFAAFLFYVFRRSKNLGLTVEESENTTEAAADGISKVKPVVLLIISIIGILIGGNLIVNNSTAIAHRFGMSDVLIGSTIVALGTSLPELVTSIVAALKRQSDIAIGNIIGSNIFNILIVLGVSSLIHPIPETPGINIDILFMLFATLIAFFIPLRRKEVSRIGGIMLLILYASYIVYKVLSG